MYWDIIVKKPLKEPYWEIDEGQVMPDSYIENGIRKAVIYGGDLMPDRLVMQKFAGHWLVVKEEMAF